MAKPAKKTAKKSARKSPAKGKVAKPVRKPVAKKSAKAAKAKKPARKTAAKKQKKVIALFPEAAFGPALNSVGIGQALEKLGHKVVFLSDPGFLDVYKGYGFEAHPVNLSEPLPPEEMAKFWVDFINGHIPNFRKTPYEQIDNYVKDCWGMIVETAKWAEKDLPGVLDHVKPDVVASTTSSSFPPSSATPSRTRSRGCASFHAPRTRSRTRTFPRISRARAPRTGRRKPLTASASTR